MEKDQILQTAQSQFHDHHPARKMGIKSVWIARKATMGNVDREIYDWKFATLGEMADTVEKNVQGLAAMVIAEGEEKRKEELNVFNIAPKRPNWDLKRETDKKLAKLERKTQEAIHTLIRE